MDQTALRYPCPDSQECVASPRSGDAGGSHRLHRLGIDRDDVAALRDICAFLALFLRYPQDEAHGDMGLLAKEFAPLFRAYDMQAPEVPDREELQAEYVRLFVNNLGFVPAVPYASYHLDDGGLLRGRSYFRLVEIMRAAGFELRDRVTEQADHVAVLFEFCSLLAEAVRKGQDAEQNLQTLAAVLREFIAPTVQGLAAALREHAHFDFYPRIAALGQEVLQDAADIAEKTTAAGNGENA